jgi:hypothetical protein
MRAIFHTVPLPGHTYNSVVVGVVTSVVVRVDLPIVRIPVEESRVHGAIACCLPCMVLIAAHHNQASVFHAILYFWALK